MNHACRKAVKQSKGDTIKVLQNLYNRVDYVPGRQRSPDALREDAAALVAELNRARVEDVLRIAGFATGASMERLEGAELLWVDRLGLYLLAAVRGEGAQARASGAL